MNVLEGWVVSDQPSNPPGVPVLVPHPLLNLRVRECLRHGTPLLRVLHAPERRLDRIPRLAEGVGAVVPGQLPPDGVGHCGHELPAQPLLRAQTLGELLRAVLGVGQVPLELVAQAHVPHVDVQIDQHAPVVLLAGDVLGRVVVALRVDGLRDQGAEGVQRNVQVVAEDLSELLRSEHLLVLVPHKGVAHPHPLVLQVQPHRHQLLGLLGRQQVCAAAQVVERVGVGADSAGGGAGAADCGGAGHCVQVEGHVGHGGEEGGAALILDVVRLRYLRFL